MSPADGSGPGAETPRGDRRPSRARGAGAARTAAEWADAYYLAAVRTSGAASPSGPVSEPPAEPPDPPSGTAQEPASGHFPDEPPPPAPHHAAGEADETPAGAGGHAPHEGAGPGRPTAALGASFGFPALADRQGFAAALRAFHVRLPLGPGVELDREETARNYARAVLRDRGEGGDGNGPQGGGFVPDVQWRADRSVEMVLLVDSSLAMVFQHEVVEGMRSLLGDSGIFRRLRVLQFDSDADTLQLYEATTGDRRAGLGAPDPRATQVALILTDGLGEGWRSPALHRWLADLARDRAAAIVHLLAPYQWHRSGIRPEPVDLRGAFPSRPGRPNAAYREYRRPSARPEEPAEIETEPRERRLLVPVLPLRTAALAGWSRFVMGRGPASLRCSALPVQPDGNGVPVSACSGQAPARPRGADAAAEVRRFYRGSTPAAFELATALAAAPLHPEMITAVCRWTTGEPRPPELTEIFFSGLVRVVDDTPGGDGPGAVHWDFRPEIRSTLLSLGGRRSEIRAVLALLADEFADVDPWFEAVGRMVRNENDVALRYSQSSHWWAKWTVPALDAVSSSDSHRDFIGSVFSATPTAPETHQSRLEHQHTADKIGSPKNSPAEREPLSQGVSHDDPGRTSPRLAGDFPDAPRSHPDGTTMPDSTDSYVALRPPVQQRVEPVQSRRGSPAVWGPVSRRNAAFTGRTELLAHLREKLLGGPQRTALTALYGMPGVGKTELAKEYMHRFSEEYEVIWWVPSSHVNQIHEAYGSLADGLGMETAGSAMDNVIHGVHEELRRRSSWLLVFDNADAPEALERYLPADGNGHVIVTSRDGRWATRGGDDFLEVGVFDRPESVELLRLRGPESLTTEQAERLADELGHLPLALNQAAVWLYESGISVSDYLARFADKKSEMLALLTPVDANYPIAVAAAWNVSLDQLAQTNRAALQLLQVLSFFSSVAPVPRYVFNFARDVSAPPDLQQALDDPARLGRAIRDITRFSLAQIDHRRNTLSMHALVQEAVQAPLTGDEAEALRHCVHQLLAKSDPQDNSPAAAARYAELLPHVWGSSAWNCTDGWVRALVVTEVRVAVRRGEYSEARRLAETVHALWLEKLGESDLDTLRIALQLVPAYRELGQHERALELCWHTLELLRENHGSDAQETLDAEIQYSRDLRFAGKFRESLDLAENTYHTCVRVFGVDDPQTLRASHFYAFALLLNGAVFQSAEQYRDVLTRREIVLGHDDSLTLGALDGYSDALMEAGEYHEALRLKEDLFERSRSLWGERVPSVLSNMRSLAIMQRRAGRLQDAAALSEHAWRRYSERLGPDSIDTVYSAMHYAMALQAVGRLGEALGLAEKADGKYRQLLGAEHPHVAAADVNRAIILRRLGRVVEARTLDENALRILRPAVGADHPSTLVCCANLASDLFSSGRTSDAAELDRDTLEKCGNLLTDRHPLTLLVRRNLLADRTALGEDVGEENEEVEELYSEVFGPEHPATLSLRQAVRADADIYVGQI